MTGLATSDTLSAGTFTGDCTIGRGVRALGVIVCLVTSGTTEKEDLPVTPIFGTPPPLCGGKFLPVRVVKLERAECAFAKKMPTCQK